MSGERRTGLQRAEGASKEEERHRGGEEQKPQAQRVLRRA